MIALLEQEIDTLDRIEEQLSEETKAALKDRLQFRKCFLVALAGTGRASNRESPVAWRQCMEALKRITKSSEIGVPVPESFNVKLLQRKVAGTVPPRPTVNLSLETAFDYLKRLCQDSHDILQVEDWSGGNDVEV